jgi:Domain of Unknown Function with PDB structure (DUF3857)/Transglutaminase-like superfamily
MQKLFLILLLSSNLFSQEKSKFIYNNETVFISFNNELEVESLTEHKKLIVKSKNISEYSERIHFNNFNVISEIRGKTTVLSKNDDYSVYSSSISTFDSESESVFHSDNKFKYFVFPRVEDNSTVEYSYKNKLLEPRLLSFFRFQELLKTEESTIKIVCDSNIEIGFKLFGMNQDKIVFNKIDNGKTITYLWKMKDIPAFEYENEMENINYYAPHLVYYIKNYTKNGVKTELLNNKQNLYNWYTTLIKNCNKKDLIDVKSKTIELIKDKDSDLEKAKSIFHWVQKNLNYVAFEYGMGGFIPRDASDVFQKKYGDCKDMANLLNVMFRFANLNSYLTWIGTRDKPYSYDDFPTPLVDNHMITSLKTDDKIFYFDATDKFCPFSYPSAMIQGKEALIGLSDSEFEIKKVPILDPQNNQTKIVLDLKIEDKNISGNAVCETSGLEKSKLLNLLSEYSTKEKEIWKNAITKSNEKIVLDILSTNKNSQQIEPANAKFTFQIQDCIRDIDNKFFFKPILLSNIKDKVIDIEKRKFPIKQDIKSLLDVTYNYQIPSNLEIDFVPSNFKLENDFFSLEISYLIKGKMIEVHQKIGNKTLLIENKDFQIFNSTINNIIKQPINNFKKMIKKTILLLIVFLFNNSFSQEIKNYTWDEKPNFKEIPTEFKDQPAVVLLDKRWIHTRVGYYAFASFAMNHLAIKINSADAINKYNKVKAEDNGYIRTVRDFHARIIKPNGEIKIISEEKIIETEIEKVKSIVFEGVEAGDILEYYFILKENPSSYGIEVFQKDIPVLLAEFSTTSSGVNFRIYPSKEFQFNKEFDKEKYVATNLPPINEEKQSRNIKNLVKLIYTVTTPEYNPHVWNTFMPNAFYKPSFIYFKKNQAREFIEKLNINNLSTDEKLIKLDTYIKENFDFVWRGETAKKIKNLNEGKQKLNASDIFDLYGFTLKELKIPYQIATGIDRFIGEINTEKFVVALNHEFMYYIPETQKFISPYEKYLSYGFPMYEVQGSKAIFYNTENRNSEVYSQDFPTAPSTFNTNETLTSITLKDDLTQVLIDKKLSNSGYIGQSERHSIKYLKENEEEKKLTDYIKKRIINEVDVKLLEYNFENSEIKNNYSNAPHIINSKMESVESFTENAGNLLIVNIGKVIGKPINFYQENERKTDIDLYFTKLNKHKIIFNIPNGYEVQNLLDFQIDKKMNFDEKLNCYFKSNAKIDANQLIIEVEENYQSINYSKELYQEYRKVVNANSDFFKSSLILKLKN